ncbi:MAG: DUF3418 domain-containing protein, partial [Acidimicrobiia bacterium]|nr:DUF3418 domain-containing protein [Acidimicrobiia bacterium]
VLVKGHVQSKTEWYNDAIAAALDASIASFGGPPWSEAGFEQLLDAARASMPDHLVTAGVAVTQLVTSLDRIHTKLDRFTSGTYRISVDDIRSHLARLAYPGFLTGVGLDRLDDVARYLEAIELRLDGLARNPTRDLEALAVCRRLDNELAAIASSRPWSQGREDATWMLEELRVGLFAQSLGTKGKISEKRVRRALNELRAP